jgi:CRP/FNR family cyclic AMP-dependent transcriptional regulator
MRRGYRGFKRGPPRAGFYSPPAVPVRDHQPPEFLSSLTDQERDVFQALGRPRRFARGETIFHESDDPGGVLAITRGRVKVSVLGVGGREVVLRISEPGELIGELSAIANRPRTATVIAIDEVEGIALRAAEFRRFVLEHPRVAPLIFEHVAALLTEADHQRVEFATRDVTARIANRLIELARTSGEASADGVLITLPLSQDELAAWTGASREAVARSLHLLRELGWVQTRRREIKVLNLDALQTLIQ